MLKNKQIRNTSLLGGMFILSIFLSSCGPSLSVSSAYFQEVKSGRPGNPSATEFVINFKKPEASAVVIEKVVVRGHQGMDYTFEKPVLNDATLSKTISSTTNIANFALYLKDRNTTDKTTSTSSKLMAQITYSDGSEAKNLEVSTFEDRGQKLMRN